MEKLGVKPGEKEGLPGQVEKRGYQGRGRIKRDTPGRKGGSQEM